MLRNAVEKQQSYAFLKYWNCTSMFWVNWRYAVQVQCDFHKLFAFSPCPWSFNFALMTSCGTLDFCHDVILARDSLYQILTSLCESRAPRYFWSSSRFENPCFLQIKVFFNINKYVTAFLGNSNTVDVIVNIMPWKNRNLSILFIMLFTQLFNIHSVPTRFLTHMLRI